jgi:hypothetical protein
VGLGRLCNDDWRHPNAVMRRISINGVPHLYLFAARHIEANTEIRYDYGVGHFPWRKKVACLINFEFVLNIYIWNTSLLIQPMRMILSCRKFRYEMSEELKGSR